MQRRTLLKAILGVPVAAVASRLPLPQWQRVERSVPEPGPRPMMDAIDGMRRHPRETFRRPIFERQKVTCIKGARHTCSVLDDLQVGNILRDQDEFAVVLSIARTEDGHSYDIELRRGYAGTPISNRPFDLYDCDRFRYLTVTDFSGYID